MRTRIPASSALLAAAVVLVGGGTAVADASTNAAAFNSPGVLSGNLLTIPVNAAIDVCNDAVNTVSLLTPGFGNTCVNRSISHHAEGDRGN
ncbi:chaplin [Streptomyces sp. NPDC048281]|uniref:chaplin n=1 Tax=Streptomyces sp. NPDC048281 TaxID=3154715 RepID=UPI00341C40A3